MATLFLILNVQSLRTRRSVNPHFLAQDAYQTLAINMSAMTQAPSWISGTRHVYACVQPAFVRWRMAALRIATNEACAEVSALPRSPGSMRRSNMHGVHGRHPVHDRASTAAVQLYRW
jgi:hypothetical protein